LDAPLGSSRLPRWPRGGKTGQWKKLGTSLAKRGVRRPTRVLDVDPVAIGGSLVPHGAAERHPRGVAEDSAVEEVGAVNGGKRVGSGRATNASTATSTKDLDWLIPAGGKFGGIVLGNKAFAVHVRQDPFWRERAEGVKNTSIGTNCARPFPPKKKYTD